MDMETMAKYKIPAMIQLHNNNGWATMESTFWGTGKELIHCFQKNLRYDMIADALGGKGWYVTKADGVRPAIDEAYEWMVKNSKPVLLNIQSGLEYYNLVPGTVKFDDYRAKYEPGCTSYTA